MNTLRNTLKQQYSQIPNELITDLTLCHGSLRVLLYLFTKPDSWNVYNKDICKQLDISEQTLTKYWKKLLASRWLRREVSKNKDGKLTGGYTYQIGNFTVSIQSTETVKSIDHSNNKLIKKKETNIKKKLSSSERLFDEYMKSKDNISANETKYISDFLVYRKQLKKAVKTILPLESYWNTLVDLHTKKYDIKKCIEIMKENEWQTIKEEWLKNKGVGIEQSPNVAKGFKYLTNAEVNIYGK